MKNDLISRSALLNGFDVCKVTEYDESGCGVDYLAVSVDAIKKDPAVDAEPVRRGSWKHIKKHLWYKDANGDVDMWYVDHGYHNGPGCKICGESFCEHCNPNWADDECEIGYYVCTGCEQSTETGDSPYCPNCGAKMDAQEEA